MEGDPPKMARSRKRSKKRNAKVATIKRVQKDTELNDIKKSLDLCLLEIHEQQISNQKQKHRLLEVRNMIQNRLHKQPGIIL